ncbi:Txe/YoeB family addiction module toxin [Daejeonella sp.]|uniref:Txe/YoeB family addiction module toxin n=1 Tax=Daejeonella sp. TaxID=2805397 RepID=UPI00271E4C9B|nr:Txe/YoeB family addiction module toxin [Daejeonella sp.]MDO8994511.1 Txe/YoeB family addiction module toxin [Daejeonella sp.]MDP2414926.1 Txe/YoeB family addiction module toxin [Daejeonella sp.]
MKYTLEFTEQAIDDLRLLKRSEPLAYKKAQKLLSELMKHPRTGTSKPEMKKYDLAGLFSRRISQKHRLVYQIRDETVTVIVITAAGHYHDK